MEIGAPEHLKSRIREDMGPRRPLSATGLRVWKALPLWASLFLATWLLFGVRADYDAVGFWGTWGLSTLQAGLTLVLFRMLLRGTIPGSLPSAGETWLLAGGLVATHLLSAAVLQTLHLNVPPAGMVFDKFVACLALITGLALVTGIAGIWMIRRGLVSHPFRTGLLCGLTFGVAAEAAWRTHCPFTNWGHILSSHTGGIVLISLLVAVLLSQWPRQLK